MKKLMVAAAVAMLGIAANAGAYVWGFSDGSIEDSSGNYIEGGTAMLFIGKGAQTGTTLDLSAIVESLVTTGAQNPDPDYNFGTFTVTTAKGDDQELHITGPLSDLVDNSKTQDYTLILFEESGVGTSADYMGNY